jgi:hypothetical protein
MYPAALLRLARETKITLVPYPADAVRNTTTALQDSYANGAVNKYKINEEFHIKLNCILQN